MDVEAPKDTRRAPATAPSPAPRAKGMHWLLVAINCGMLTLGTTGGPLITRLYYSKGGHRQWLSAWIETAAWPLLLIIVVASYITRRARDPSAPLLLTRPRILLAAVPLGLAMGADNFLYAFGLSYLPVSTSAILISTQLAFTVFFAFLIVRQRLTASSLNAVALLTIGAVVLGLHASSDRPAGVSRGQYWLGFVLTLGAAALYGLMLPLVELTYKRAAGGGRVLTYALVIEVQLVMSFVATAFGTVGMVVNNDFQVPTKDCTTPVQLINTHSQTNLQNFQAVAELLTIGAIVLGLHASSDGPARVTKGQYWLGFFPNLGAAALYGLVLPLIELTYKHGSSGGRFVTYALVIEMQLAMGFFAIAFCTVGVNNDF
ncbi:hypothetical protein ACQ4PT_032181 [Festuca glaucescens]